MRRKTTGEKSSEINAIAKSSDNPGLEEGFSGIRDVEIGSNKRDEASDNNPLSVQATKQLVAHRPRRGGEVTEAGGEAPNR